MWNDIKQCTKIFNKANVETNAYVRGISEMYGVDLQRHKADLMMEMNDDEKAEKDAQKKSANKGIDLDENTAWKS